MANETIEFLDRIASQVDGFVDGVERERDPEAEFLQTPAPNIIEWITGLEYWNVPSTFEHSRQYQILRDVFNLRCPLCNSMKPEDIDTWGKGRASLEAETLFTWSEVEQDFVCPGCKSTQRELLADKVITPYNEMIVIAGMRSGKSFTGAHIGGYFEHFLITRGARGRGYLQRLLKQEKSEWFEITFAASTATQAAQTIYAKYREMRSNSPWIGRYMKWVRAKEKAQIGERADKWRYKVNDDAILDGYIKCRFNRIASDSAGIAGKTRISAFIDEWARLVDTEGTRSSLELYRVLNQSLKTVRASQELNHLPHFLGLMVNVTSPLAQDDPAMTTYAKAASGELKKTYGWKGATWEFNPFMPEHLFEEEFVKDPVAAGRDFGAAPPNADMPYVDDPNRFWKSIDWKRNPTATFTETYLNDATGKQYVGIDLDHAVLDHVNSHYIFGDAGLSWDSFALVCAHPEWISADALEREDSGPEDQVDAGMNGRGRILPHTANDVVFAEDMGTYMGSGLPVAGDGMILHEEQQNRRRMLTAMVPTPTGAHPYDHRGEMLCTVIDFAVRIVPTNERDIWFNSVVSIIEQLRKKMRIAGIAFDRWNSESTIQQIRSMGILASKVTLKPEHFMGFLRMTYNGRVGMLPPRSEDMVGLAENGHLVLGTAQEQMEGRSVALVELLKLSRTPDLRKFHNQHKGKVRGRDSDDLARCYIGVHHLVQDSIVDELADSKKRRGVRKRQIATDSASFGTVVRGPGW